MKMTLDDLMNLPGALAAFTYSDKGDLTGQRIREGTEITPQVLDLLAHSCVANIAVATLEARGWESVTGQQGFEPLQGFTMIGLEWSAVVNGNCGVVAKNRDVDYEATFAAISRCAV
jgi:roadblock/LC7 domain-containing protein